MGADTGQWETVRIVGDEQLQSEWNWFRIGFEPMFTDYTKSGTWFVLVSLFEVRGIPDRYCIFIFDLLFQSVFFSDGTTLLVQGNHSSSSHM